MSTPIAGAAADLFRQAVATVRAYPIDSVQRRPAFTFPPTAALPVRPGTGRIEGVPGDLWSLREDIVEGRLSVAAIVERARARVAAHGERLRAFECVVDTTDDADRLDEEARGGRWRGVLHGLPISVKDVIDVAGMPTSGSSSALPARMAQHDATAVGRLRAAGALIVGKTTTHEFALGVTTPQAHNPWDEAHVPGGSSGGSAISVVTGMAAASLATDTRASIRVPSALTGIVGCKPSQGLVPVDAWLTLSWTMDHFGPIARSVRDIALMLDVLADTDGYYRAVLPGDAHGRTIGYSDVFLDGAAEDVRRCFDSALAAVERAGGRIVRTVGPTRDDLALANAAGMVLSRAEAAQVHLEAGTDLERCTPEVGEQLREAAQLTSGDYLRSLRIRGQLREQLLHAFAEVDLMIMPTTKVAAPRRAEAHRYLLILSENCIPWSFVDFPAISLYAGLSGRLPLGVQLVAKPGQDALLLSVAHALERTLPSAPDWSPT